MRKREKKVKETLFFFFSSSTCRGCHELAHSRMQYCPLEATIFTTARILVGGKTLIIICKNE